ncbi:uncharacterized protein LOC124988459 [Sciurus carolinensis]|uniref:uncharacterized protein LOC124988459 n=1 Tax=Sciurus carolinensis TaxID=30640 RepID=UPI001FB53BC1|nr:uncharacterized protein LOC124988459 [Sciurus carolinensis]
MAWGCLQRPHAEDLSSRCGTPWAGRGLRPAHRLPSAGVCLWGQAVAPAPCRPLCHTGLNPAPHSHLSDRAPLPSPRLPPLNHQAAFGKLRCRHQTPPAGGTSQAPTGPASWAHQVRAQPSSASPPAPEELVYPRLYRASCLVNLVLLPASGSRSTPPATLRLHCLPGCPGPGCPHFPGPASVPPCHQPLPPGLSEQGCCPLPLDVRHGHWCSGGRQLHTWPSSVGCCSSCSLLCLVFQAGGARTARHISWPAAAPALSSWWWGPGCNREGWWVGLSSSFFPKLSPRSVLAQVPLPKGEQDFLLQSCRGAQRSLCPQQRLLPTSCPCGCLPSAFCLTLRSLLRVPSSTHWDRPQFLWFSV